MTNVDSSSKQNAGGSGKKSRRRRRRKRGGGGGGKPSTDTMPQIEDPTEAVRGVLDVQRDHAGWLRQVKNNYVAAQEPDEDVFVPVALIKEHRIFAGSELVGKAGIPGRGAQRLTLATIESIDGLSPEESAKRRSFKDLTVIDPEPQFVLEPDDGDVSLRIIDLLCPIGAGQRGLIVAPPRSGKTVLMQKICTAIAQRYPACHVIVLLVDERPEEATGWRRSAKGEHCEVLVSTLDEGPKNHIGVAEMAMKRAHRLVETGKDVVILLDSITRLTRAYNSDMGGRGGHTMSGGIGANVIEHPKKFFGSARKSEEGGSLTILATTLVDTGSRMDQVIFEEFKGTGNMELVLNRQLAERRIFPAIDIEMSGTRKEELLLPESVVTQLYTLRRVLARMNVLDAMPLLIDRVMKTKTNAEFLTSFRVEE